ncbi:MAG: Uma2 family endonuclease [Bacillota bacterium]
MLDFINIVQPDLLFLSTERLRLLTARNIAGPPDLVVEILSHSTAERDRGEKAHLYASHGVKHDWVVAPSERTLDAYRLRPRGPGRREQHLFALVLSGSRHPSRPDLGVSAPE